MSRYQKDKTNLDFTEARDSEWQWHLLGHMQICTSLQTDNHASTPSLSFLQAGCPSCHPTNSSKALKAKSTAGKGYRCFHIYYLKTIFVFWHCKWPAQGTSTVPVVWAHFCSLQLMMWLYSARELELEDRQSRLEAQLRERIASEGNKQ